MVRGTPSFPVASAQPAPFDIDKDKKQSPEDASMHNGLFNEYNTTAPKSDSIHELCSLKHKTAIISGAGAGIGFAVAQAYAEAGANVAIWYHSNKDAIEKAKGLEQKFGVKGTLH